MSSNLPVGLRQSDLDRHLDGDRERPPCPYCDEPQEGEPDDEWECCARCAARMERRYQADEAVEYYADDPRYEAMAA